MIGEVEIVIRLSAAQFRVLSAIGELCDRVDELPVPPDDPWRAPDVRWLGDLVREAMNDSYVPRDRHRAWEALGAFLEALPKEELAAESETGR